MALRALTPSGTAYCSDCGAETLPDAEECAVCGRQFEGVLDAIRCPFCGAILFRGATECYHCGREVGPLAPPPEREAGRREERHLRSLLDATEKAVEAPAGASVPAPPADPPPPPPDAPPKVTGAADEGTALWMLSEPFQRMLVARKKRIEQMDAIVARARRRVRMLEVSQNPIEMREREELKRQIAEILVEREDILKIEEGIMGMERIYRNILHLQQTQLRDREDSLKARLETFRKELERREQEKEHIKEREKDLDTREQRLGERMRDLEEKTARLSAIEEELKRRGPRAPTPPSPEEITIEPADAEIHDLKLRLTELEEQMEKLAEEKNRLSEERQRASAFYEEVKGVLRTLDELLGNLPEARIKKFAKSEDFQAYEKVLDALGM